MRNGARQGKRRNNRRKAIIVQERVISSGKASLFWFELRLSMLAPILLIWLSSIFWYLYYSPSQADNVITELIKGTNEEMN
jgi:hypothetical protein